MRVALGFLLTASLLCGALGSRGMPCHAGHAHNGAGVHQWPAQGLLARHATTQAQSSSLQPLLVGEAPWFCHGIECPPFKVIEATEDYEVRRYSKGAWVSTTIETYAWALASSMGFKRLFNYIDGGNAAGVKIPMTAPVRTRVDAAAGPFCKNNFTVSFYVPEAHAADPPKPNDTNIFISRQKGFTAYVAQAGGFVVDDYSISKMANSLSQALDAAGERYDASFFYFAGYDPPFRLTGRHNELWLVAEADDPPAQPQRLTADA